MYAIVQGVPPACRRHLTSMQGQFALNIVKLRVIISVILLDPLLESSVCWLHQDILPLGKH